MNETGVLWDVFPGTEESFGDTLSGADDALMEQTESNPIFVEFKTLFENTTENYSHQDFLKRMEQFLKSFKGEDLMRANNSFCEWYLPTVEEVPIAMGTFGIVLWVLGSIITLTMIVLLGKHAIFLYRTAHKRFRIHLFYISSIYMVMALLTSIGTGIPRAQEACSALKDIFMCLGMGHFVDLTFAMYGGENVMTFYVKERLVDITNVPLLCCCICIPKCITTRNTVRILKWLVWQMKWSQTAYYLLKLILERSSEDVLGINPLQSSYVYLNILNIISFVPGVIAIFLIGSLVREDLQKRYNYAIKEKLVRLTILTTKLQKIIFEILFVSGVFPCYPPLVSSKFYKNILKDFIYLLEVLILGSLTYFVYTRRNEFEVESSKEFKRNSYQVTPVNDENGAEDATALRHTISHQEHPC